MQNCIFNLTLDLRSTKKLIRQKRKEYNDNMRVDSPADYKKQSIKANVLHTLWTLLNFYASHLYQMEKLKPLERPAFKTNNPKIARNTGYSATTIWRHINILMQPCFNIITLKNFHGTKADYDIEFNPEFLVASRNYAFSEWVKWAYMKCHDLQMLSVDKITGLNTIMPRFSDAVCGTYKIAVCNHINTRTFNNINMKSGISEFADELIAFNNNFINGKFPNTLIDSFLHEHKKQSTMLPEGQNNKHFFVENEKDFPGGKKTGILRQKSSDIKLYSYIAWNFAFSILWKDKKLAPELVNTAQNYIQKYFASANDYPGHAQILMNAFCQRIILTHNYINRSPERFVPLPNVYFNPFFKNGFTGTEAWLQKVEERRKNDENYYSNIKLLSKLYRDYCKDMSLHNYNQALKHLSRTRNPGLIKIFNRCVLNHQEFNPGLFARTYQQHLKRAIAKNN